VSGTTQRLLDKLLLEMLPKFSAAQRRKLLDHAAAFVLSEISWQRDKHTKLTLLRVYTIMRSVADPSAIPQIMESHMREAATIEELMSSKVSGDDHTSGEGQAPDKPGPQ
jgi:hypothetical protein